MASSARRRRIRHSSRQRWDAGYGGDECQIQPGQRPDGGIDVQDAGAVFYFIKNLREAVTSL
jgi:hypothetical protein